MKIYIVIATCFAFCVFGISLAQEKPEKPKVRIAVADFEVSGGVKEEDVGRSFAELLLTKLADKFEVIERTQLIKLLDEQELQMSDLVEPEKAARIKGVSHLVLGRIIKLGAKLTITARLVNVGTGTVIKPRISEVGTKNNSFCPAKR
jgi:TolB-like protein